MADPELKWWHVRWEFWGRGFKKVGFWLAVILAVGWTFDLVLACNVELLGPYLTARSLRNEPEAWIIPSPAPDLSAVQLSGATVKAFGYSIQTPWAEQPVIRAGTTFTSAGFAKEGGILVFDNPDFAGKVAQSMRETPEGTVIFRNQERRSNYDMMAAAMDTTPGDAAWWKTPFENQRVLILLSSKLFTGVELSAVYKVSGPVMRGFQFEYRRLTRKRVQLKLFDPADRELDIQILDGIGDRPTLTQPQINSMVASIRLIDHK